jgi:hypothetical protein
MLALARYFFAVFCFRLLVGEALVRRAICHALSKLLGCRYSLLIHLMFKLVEPSEDKLKLDEATLVAL